MFFKVEKGVALWGNLEALMNKIISVRKAAADLTEELGFKKYGQAHFVIAGGISYIASNHHPDGYRKVGSKWDGLYFPKASNKEITKKISELPTISYDEYNAVINFKDQFQGLQHIMAYGLKKSGDTFLIEVSDRADYTPVDGMVEILASEYKMWVDSIGEKKIR